ncbi:MAG: hypothetical protein K9N23_01750 [Akkermansiaceae bacterium]|nr:hypothetical protein [Akkermansiaceae bacterium]MCF7730374.1 hypothetical protein [Akkermansiaceae bacterium]
MRAIPFAFIVSLLAAMAGFAKPAAPAAPPDVRITVKAVTAGTDHKGKTTVSSRRLQIQLENREHRDLKGLQLEWKIVGEDIQNHRKSITAKGNRTVNLDADGNLDIESDVARFSKTEGGVKTIGRGKNRRRVGQPDTGHRYAGYVAELKQGGKVIAEASTNGIQKQLK